MQHIVRKVWPLTTRNVVPRIVSWISIKVSVINLTYSGSLIMIVTQHISYIQGKVCSPNFGRKPRIIIRLK